jgi:hypothetical protein
MVYASVNRLSGVPTRIMAVVGSPIFLRHPDGLAGYAEH